MITPSTQSHPKSWWVYLQNEQKWASFTASKVLDHFESGVWTGETLIKVTQASQAKPLKHHIRELVWSAHTEYSVSDQQDTAFEIVKHAPIPTALSDLAGRITYANKAFCDFIEYTQEQLMGMNVGALSHKDDHQKEAIQGNRLIAGQLGGFQMS